MTRLLLLVILVCGLFIPQILDFDTVYTRYILMCEPLEQPTDIFTPPMFPSVKFLVTADPQYDIENFDPIDGLTRNSDNFFKIAEQKLVQEGFRGLLIAGDLTHNARKEEFQRYQEMTKNILPYLYDGLGNHDFRQIDEVFDSTANANFGFESFLGEDFLGWDVGSLALFDYVRSHPRNTPINGSYPNIHYSWDWENIHFIHLNLYPSNEPRPKKTIQNPFKSFDFLKKDLATHVGDSGRPVILMHHYGFDNFSRGILEDGSMSEIAQWWSVKDQNNYEELLKDYNVIAIFSGHAHNCQIGSDCYLPWYREDTVYNFTANSTIPTFVSGSAREGYHLEVEISDKLMTVNRYSLNKLVGHYEFCIQR